MLGTLADKFKSAKSSYDEAGEAQKQKVSASLEDDIQALVGELKKSIETSKKLESEYRQSQSRSKQLEESVEESKKKVELEKKELDKNSKELTVSLKKNSDEKADIANRLLSLKEQELDAENGFSKKHMAMLDKFEDDKEKLLDGYNSRKANLEVQIKELRTSRNTLSEDESNLLDKKLKELSKKEEVLAVNFQKDVCGKLINYPENGTWIRSRNAVFNVVGSNEASWYLNGQKVKPLQRKIRVDRPGVHNLTAKSGSCSQTSEIFVEFMRIS